MQSWTASNCLLQPWFSILRLACMIRRMTGAVMTPCAYDAQMQGQSWKCKQRCSGHTWTWEAEGYKGFIVTAHKIIVCLHFCSKPSSSQLKSASLCNTNEGLPLKGSRLNLAVGVVQTPLRSSEFPSMVFILENVSALLHVDRAGISESRQLRSLGFSFCQNKTYASQKWSNIGLILPLPHFMFS